MIPYKNAVLTAITAVGTTQDYDVPAQPGVDRWTGSEPIYVSETLTDVQSSRVGDPASGQRLDILVATRLEVPYPIGRLAASGDTVTYTYEGAERVRLINDILLSPLVNRARLVLADA